ncbi:MULTISPECIES: NAD(P)-dependent oxidoreductase [unclassified Chelatococcus]|uniref:NAD-dependent epimerase/dehydratase family protein n=1 Tax=unclassified Chelatococcus TaxID=2638111 RepID=UPI001BD1688E|nr:MULTISPECIES: NAD(P)-dependent oxidoreductase [unclassified Chelatococcus]MBS7700013.1 NAD(P)-dependent oxidoreductase [Chelatococcus sp. YT9]MBX3558562.1 NAD(P)-dependent oxidoreductase [Chelatococcus sp.]
MGKKIFLAGATGAIGKRLTLLLAEAGHHVIGTTRSPGQAKELSRSGVEPVIVDVFDAEALHDAVVAARPDVVVHQLSALPPGLDPTRMKEALRANARVREEGTRNLVSAARAAGCRRLIAQSIAWLYAAGPQPFVEASPLINSAVGELDVTRRGVIALEESVLNAAAIDGLVLRYGRIYGPGTGFDAPPASLPLHVDAAAYAAFLAIEHGQPGAYNIVEPNEAVATHEAVTELGWSSVFREPADL